MLEKFEAENRNYFINFGGRKLYALLDDKESVARKVAYQSYEELVKGTAKNIGKEYLYLDRAIADLENHRKAGENYYVEFKGQKLYSMLDDRDSSYWKVTGKTYEDYANGPEAAEKAREKERLHRQLETLDKVPDWISKGKELVYPQQKMDWAKFVKDSVDLGYERMPNIDHVLDIMQSLAKDGDMEKAYKQFKLVEDLGKNSKSPVLEAVANFSKDGAEFFKYVCEKEGLQLGDTWIDYLNEIDNKFAKYEKEANIKSDESEM